MENFAVWFEIPVTDMERARKFYSELFRIEMELQDIEGMPHAFFPMEGYANGGALVKHHDFIPSAKGLTVYLNGGEDLSGALSRVGPAGGKIIVPKTKISEEIGYYALFLDTEGNRIGLFSMK